MPFQYPINRYRPTRVSDGEGGYTETLGAAVVMYGALEIHKDRTSLRIDHQEDIKVGDIIGINDGTEKYYRVLDSMRLPGTRWKMMSLEKTDRPIAP